MAAAPTHYIRTIHTSFTAAHPHSSSWASAAAQRSPSTAAGLLNIGANANTQHYMPQQYHLVPKYPPPGLSYGRRRASAVSISSSSRPTRVAPPPAPAKFDPFADEPLSPPVASSSRLSPSLYNHQPPAAPRPAHAHLPRSPAKLTYAGPTSAPPRRVPVPLYTIHIPEARAPSASAPQQQQRRAPRSSPSPPPAPQPSLRDKDARSKLVAGILLNRVHAVGKPMRRRPSIPVPGEKREYVRSGLSRCIAVEA